MKSKALILLVTCAAFLNACNSTQPNDQANNEFTLTQNWQPLLDKDLSLWHSWMGVPHTSIKQLPEGTYTANNLQVNGSPQDAMGKNADIKNVYSVITENGETVLKVTGEIYGGLTSNFSVADYHLSLQVKWGDKKWAPRLDKKKDSGLLFHCSGPHGAFWRVWKACQELQIQEKDFGDYIPLAGPKGDIRVNPDKNAPTYYPFGTQLKTITGYSHAYKEPDYANGEWNTIDLYAFGDKALFVVNGVQVMLVENSRDKNNAPLTSGELQLQSEGAEVYFKNVKIRAISQLPTIDKG
jgi:hypothetical protein